MSDITSRQDTLSQAVFGAPSSLRNAALVIGGSFLLIASAKVQVPFYPVPMTMQTFVVLFLGFALGARMGTLAVLAYLAQGAAGLPVFAGTPEKGIGLAYMMGPTGGYLLGFALAAGLTGGLAERGFDRHPLKAAIAAFAGLVVIYALGLAWLGSLVGWDKPILSFGLWPFLPAEVFKLALLALVLPLFWRGLGTR